MVRTTSRIRRRPAAMAAVLVSAAGALLAFGTSASPAAAAPAATRPTTVSADGLPTMQINGVVWAQVTVGNTVYATGSFSKARPAGAAVGQKETAVGNIVAYDITTGVMVASFVHSMNGQGLSLAASPDGSTVYVGGDFTAIDGKTRNHLAAFSTASGALVGSFAPYVGSSVGALAATNSAVYVGGSFASAGGQARANLAAFTPTSGLLPWAPTADDGSVTAMVLTPDKSRVIVGGKFGTLDHQADPGMGSLDASTGAVKPWAANQTIRAHDSAGGAYISSLSTDGKQIYGTGVNTGGVANFEGRFAADPTTGALAWVNDCHGDTYSTFVIGQAIYSVGHNHDCTATGTFSHPYGAFNSPQVATVGPWTRALAESTVSSGGTNVGPDSYNYNYNGVPDTEMLDWFPDMAAGTFTGQVQAAWSLTGNSSYLAAGGEFPTVNRQAQQGLVRFAVRAIAPDKVGPDFNSVNVAPTVTAGSTPGSAIVSWTAGWDRDDRTLTYNLYRDGGTTPIYTTTLSSRFWSLPRASYTDTGLTGGTHSYFLRVLDPSGNTVKTPTSSVAVAAGGTPASTGDLALGKPVFQSSAYISPGTDVEPARAVDGNTDGTWGANSVTTTGDGSMLYPWWQPAVAGTAPSQVGGHLEQNPWLEVDLQASNPLDSISLWNRTDCCAGRLSNYWVLTSNTPFDTSLSPAVQASQPGVWSSYQAAAPAPHTTIQLPAGATGRYVLIQDVGANQLHLAEVQVYRAVPPTAQLEYSTNNGATWSNTITAAPGATVLVRQWYTNASTHSYAGESEKTTVPAGARLVTGSTKVCTSPLTTNPVTPNAGQDLCAAVTESAVWSGSSLTVSPIAGLYGQPSNQTAGVLSIGRVRYLNLADCAYATPDGVPFTTVNHAVANTPFLANTSASNTPIGLACGPGTSSYTYQPVNGGMQNIDLLGNRYLNLADCAYSTPNGIPFTTVNHAIANTPFLANTSASNTPTSLACGPGTSSYTYQPVNGGMQNIDLLDTTRGRGYVQYSMVLPSPAATTNYTQPGSLTGPAAATANGTITVKKP